MSEPRDEPRVWTEQQIRVGLNTSNTLAEKRALVLRAYDETEAALGERCRQVKEAQQVYDNASAALNQAKNAEGHARSRLQYAKQQMVALMHKDGV